MEEIRSRYGQYASLFGHVVDVVVNRPLGSYPQGKGNQSYGAQSAKRRKRYPVNCGYIVTDLSSLYPAQKMSGRGFDVEALPPKYVYILGVEGAAGNIPRKNHRCGSPQCPYHAAGRRCADTTVQL